MLKILVKVLVQNCICQRDHLSCSSDAGQINIGHSCAKFSYLSHHLFSCPVFKYYYSVSPMGGDREREEESPDTTHQDLNEGGCKILLNL
jgi:hypothetical protein